MTLRRAEALQWIGLLGAALTWTAQFVIGLGVTIARCGAGGAGWGLSLHTWELTLAGVALAFVLVSEAAAVTILLETRQVAHDDPPPWGRRHFFAAGAAVGNVLFLMIVVLATVGVLSHGACRQA